MQSGGKAITDFLGTVEGARGAWTEDRKRYLDALENIYGDQLKAGDASGRCLLAKLATTHGGKPRTPLAKEFFARLLPMLAERDQEFFLDEMLRDMKLTTYQRLDEHQRLVEKTLVVAAARAHRGSGPSAGARRAAEFTTAALSLVEMRKALAFDLAEVAGLRGFSKKHG